MLELNSKLAEEWKNLPPAKKKFYQKVYEIRMKERSDLQEEYSRLTKTKKRESGYVCYYKKRFAQLNREHPGLEKKEISKMVSADWRVLKSSEK